MHTGHDPEASPAGAAPLPTGVTLFWLPLGAGGHFVRMNGKVFEFAVAYAQRRSPRDLYHSALEVHVPDGRYVIEMTPIRRSDGVDRGVVAGGAVGMQALGALSIFRYEIRRWRGGVIPDVAEAVGGPLRLTDDAAIARRLLELVPSVPCPVWGRDELGLGEMWNSNSVTSWLIAASGLDADRVVPPPNGRAPGWAAGIAAAQRSRPAVHRR